MCLSPKHKATRALSGRNIPNKLHKEGSSKTLVSSGGLANCVQGDGDTDWTMRGTKSLISIQEHSYPALHQPLLHACKKQAGPPLSPGMGVSWYQRLQRSLVLVFGFTVLPWSLGTLAFHSPHRVNFQPSLSGIWTAGNRISLNSAIWQFIFHSFSCILFSSWIINPLLGDFWSDLAHSVPRQLYQK